MKISNYQLPRTVGSPDYKKYMKIGYINAQCNCIFKVRQVQKINAEEKTITLEDIYSININDPKNYYAGEFIPKKEYIHLYRLTNNIPFSTIFLKIIDNVLYICKEFQGTWEIDFDFTSAMSPIVSLMKDGDQSNREVSIDDAILAEDNINGLQNIKYGSSIIYTDIFGNKKFIEGIKEYKYDNLPNKVLKIKANVILPYYAKIAIYKKTSSVQIIDIFTHSEGGNKLLLNPTVTKYYSKDSFFELYKLDLGTSTELYIKLISPDTIIRILDYTNINIDGASSDNISSTSILPLEALKLNVKEKIVTDIVNTEYLKGPFAERPVGLSDRLIGLQYIATDLTEEGADPSVDGVILFYRGMYNGLPVWTNAMGKIYK